MAKAQRTRKLSNKNDDLEGIEPVPDSEETIRVVRRKRPAEDEASEVPSTSAVLADKKPMRAAKRVKVQAGPIKTVEEGPSAADIRGLNTRLDTLIGLIDRTSKLYFAHLGISPDVLTDDAALAKQIKRLAQASTTLRSQDRESAHFQDLHENKPPLAVQKELEGGLEKDKEEEEEVDELCSSD